MNNIDTLVRDTFAQVTRYPIEILDPDAHLEDDLGIDSVKLGEVLAVLRERLRLPEQLDIARETLATIGSISRALLQYSEADGNNQSKKTAGSNGSNGVNATHRSGPAVAAAPVPLKVAGDVVGTVRTVFAEVTRYPVEILDANASLEEDLGIDSVKMGEVFAVLRERFALPSDLTVPREALRTIAEVAEQLHEYLRAPSGGEQKETSRPISPSPDISPMVPPGHDLEQRVRQIFADVTRYPAEILEPAAALEDDLGIDSVKLGEVFAVLREQFSLPETLDIPREKLRTIADITEALRARLKVEPALPAAKSNGAPSHINGHSNGHAANASAHLQSSALYAYQQPTVRPFTGKVAFVSGSGRGLGKDIAAYLAELGASVVVNSFHSRPRGEETAQEIRDNGGDALHVWGSMANPEHVERVFEQIETQYGHLDFFIGNASNGMLARLEDITAEHWEKAFRTNIVGLHQSALRAVKLMRARGGGKIITLSSPASHGYVDYFGCMGAVKAAVESLTRSMAIEFAPYNIQVNCVSPGPVYGELLDKWPESKRLIRQWEGNTAYERLCKARDVSHFIAYLLSEPVKLFTGSVLVIDGGISSQGW